MSNVEYAQFTVVGPEGTQKHYFQGPDDKERQDYGGTDPKTVPAALTRLSSGGGWEVVGPPTQKLKTASGGSRIAWNTAIVIEETYLLRRFTAK